MKLASVFAFALATLIPVGIEARVERVEVLSRHDVLDGKAFGEAGAYEKLSGKVHFAIKPEASPNKLIVDLEKAPRNAAGEVEFAADFYILKPKEVARSNGSVLLEIPNRGGKGLLAIMQGGKGSRDPATEEEFGDGFLMRRGTVVAWLGWQWDVREEAGLMRLYAPIAEGDENPKSQGPGSKEAPSAKKENGKPITGLVRADFMVNEKTEQHPLGHFISGNIGGTEYYAWHADDPANVLTVRDAPMAKRRVIPIKEWDFVGSTGAKSEPGPRTIRLNGGFEPGKIYEVVYRARDPAIAGLGFAAVRDFASYLKQEKNELAPARRVYAAGISQSGRFLRHFLYEGFNADEAGKQAVDGMFVNVAGGGMGSFNHRFAQPSRDAQPTTALFYPTDVFPFADTPQTDPKTGQTAGLLDRAKAASVLPKIFYTNTSYEYWSRAASLIHTTPDGKRDLPLMENVRVYLLAGLQHFTAPFPPTRVNDRGLLAQHLPNTNPVRWFWRALFVAMDDWVRDGQAPPESRYPKLADKTLVKRDHVNFPRIRGVKLPERVHEALRFDFGRQWKQRIITKQPPGVGKPFPIFVPQVDADGNDLGGVRLPQLEVPLAAYTGWNLRDPTTGMAVERVSFLGSWFPLPKTKADAEAKGDPRVPIAERYQSREEFLEKFSGAANKLVDDRFLLKEDAEALVRRGGEEWDLVTR
ncbi:MAG TPA: alpha/beta hydrolase domain-containing protein [Chthoniobacterales bacterium]|nr:alpha/beta hydrolase domain-containing protein [Chthoniobacterales bacterium]